MHKSESVVSGLYPIFLHLKDRTVLVVGAGEVAHHKIRGLLDAGARVRVVAPTGVDAIAALAQIGQIQWDARPFCESDVFEAWLVIAATSDSAVQKLVSTAAAAHRVFVIAVDDPTHASAFSGSVVSRPPLTIAISSSGDAPALSRLLREIIEQILPNDDWIDHAKRLRSEWRRDHVPMGERFAGLVREFKNRQA
jgi:uroporphyrin-III C-methyltransferase/precorrin-2 dehydrogenase/sirohydrochlorin ferrochelatase